MPTTTGQLSVSSLIMILLWGIVVMWADVLQDYKQIKRNEQIHHGQSIVLMLMLYIGGIAVMGYVGAWNLHTILCVGVMMSNFPFQRWVIHDTFLNHLRGLGPDYISSDPIHAARSDRFLSFMWTEYGMPPFWTRIFFMIIWAFTSAAIDLIVL